MFGIWSTFMPLGTTLAIVGAPLLLDHGGWRIVWLASSCCCLRGGRFYSQSPHVYPPHRQPDTSRQHRWPPLLPYCGGCCGAGGSWPSRRYSRYIPHSTIAATTVLPGLLTDSYGYAPRQAALMAATVSFVNAAGNFLGGWLTATQLPRCC